MTTMPRYHCEVDGREIELGEPVVWAAQQVNDDGHRDGDEITVRRVG